jgi:adenylate cyclase
MNKIRSFGTSTLKKILPSEQLNSLVLFGLCFFVALCVFFFTGQKPFRLIELKMLDYRFQYRGKTSINKDIILVSIGEKDIELLGRWPWPRRYHSDLIQILSSYGTKIIGYDVLFCGPDKDDPQSDACLAESVKEAGNVCLPMAFSGNGKDGNDLMPLDCFHNVSAGCGFVNVFPDEDGIVRHIPLRFRDRSAFGLELACKFLGVENGGIELIAGKSLTLNLPGEDRISIPLDQKNRMLINYPGKSKDWPWTNFVQIIMAFMQEQKGEKRCIDLGLFKDKIVLVGSTHTGMPDVLETPFGASAYGVELHASIINSILGRNFLRPIHSWIEALIYFVLTVGTILILCRVRPLSGGLLSATILMSFIVTSYFLFSWFNIWLKIVKPVSGLLAVYITGLAYHFVTVERKEREIRKAFRHYVSPAVVSELTKDPERLKLGGETKELTILFSDIRGFTTLSENVPPDFLGEMLNEYFSAMTGSVFAHGGTLDKFIGDAIMAIYGAPIDLPDHPMRGCLSALSMIDNLKTLNSKWENEGKSLISIGIGLNTGIVKVGNFGSQERFDYTVIGENVNLASRLEGLTKSYGVDIIISAATQKSVWEKILCRPLDMVMVKGSKKPMEIFELVGAKNNLSRDLQVKAQNFQDGLKLYYSMKWEAARDFFAEFLDRFPNDRPAQIFLGRAEVFRKNPPPEDWDRVFSHTTK